MARQAYATPFDRVAMVRAAQIVANPTSTDDGRALVCDSTTTNGLNKVAWPLTRSRSWELSQDGLSVATASSAHGCPISAELAGLDLQRFMICVTGAGSGTGSTTFQLSRSRGGTRVDVLTAVLTLTTEYVVYTTAIDPDLATLLEGDILFADQESETHSGAPPTGVRACIVAGV